MRCDADRISSMHTPKGTPMTNNTNEHRDAISSWEDEGGGGAGLSDQRNEGIAQGKKKAEPLDSEMSLVVSRAADVYVACGTGVAPAESGISTTQMHPLPGRF
jgi:hypothetical protein